jgi:ABC-type Mn2+/Zn2+ transport system permease subunit
MEGLIILLALALIPAFIAQSKGRSFLGWYIYGIFLWIIALIHSLVLSDKSKVCPKCFAKVDERATICKACRNSL